MIANLQAEWARLLIDSLVAAGVHEAVISPGSRSTPFVLAAAAHPGLRCHDVVDERSAAFFALGQGRAAGRPTLLLPTSGTAVANYFPAVIEASASGVPLLVLSADRPVELAACGANQTIDQLKLYGAHARDFFDLGAPDAVPRALRALRALRRTAAQAVFASRWPRPGAVHLNARVRKPLEPGDAGTDEERALAAAVGALIDGQAPRPRVPLRLPDGEQVGELAAACRLAERGLIACGPAALAQAGARTLVAELARRTGFPVLREAASQLRFAPELSSSGVIAADSFDGMLKSEHFRARASPELIVQIGRCPTSGAWGRYLAEHAGCAHWVLCADGWQDAQSTATDLVFADLEGCLARLTTRLPAAGRSTTWGDLWRAAESAVQRCVDEELAAAGDALTEGGVARSLVQALPAGSLLALGNSLPIREVDAFSPGGVVDLRVLSQRGASGIDGVTSGALGAASVWRHRVALLVGDLSFLHDLSGLQAARHVGVPVVIVVVQNRGGRIFEQLPLAAHPAAGEVFEHWTTPHEIDLEPAAVMHGLAFERLERRGAFEAALERGLARPGVTLIEAVVPPHGAAEQNRRLQRRVDAALAGE